MRIGVLSCPTFPVFVGLIAFAFSGAETALGDEASAKFTSWVEQLDSDAFHTRRSASERLIEAAIGEGDQPTTESALARKAIYKGVRHRSLEVRAACRAALQKIEQMHIDRQQDRLLDPSCDAKDVSLPGWRSFSEHAGEDMPARRFFSALLNRYPRGLREIDQNRDANRSPTWHASLDPLRLAPGHHEAWGMLLWIDIDATDMATNQRNSRIAMALGNSTLGPRIAPDSNGEVLRRLIDRWLVVRQASLSIRLSLLIAMRYRCLHRANEICDRIFVDRGAPPSTVATALLSAAALGRADLESLAHSRLHDDRTAHVCQLIASRKTRIRTQVRDVALALLLRHHQVDPRKVGFDDLQADPSFIFRDHSLGFPDDTSRQRAYQSALKVLPQPLAW